MKSVSLLCCAGLISSGSACVQAKGITRDSPNILIILVDDMGYSDIGCFGSEIKTPNIDKLAKDGLVMTQFYNSGRSCPSRAALLTGMYHHKAGMGGMVKPIADVPAYQGYLNRNCMTIAEVLGANGYTTYMCGKWHLGSKEGQWPCDRGFQNSYAFLGGAGNYFFPNGDPPIKNNMVLDDEYCDIPKDDYYQTDEFSYRAADYIKGHDTAKPFFMYLSYTAPHWPLQARTEDIERQKGKYDMGWDQLRIMRYNKMLRKGILRTPYELSPRDESVPAWDSLSESEKKSWSIKMEIYAAVLERMDYGIGVVLDALKETGQLDNTVVMFMSDNGGCMETTADFVRNNDTSGELGSGKSFVCYEAPWANLSNVPFRYFKQWMHEGGISTPFIVRYPKLVKKSSISHQMGHLVDIMQTCIDLSGATYPMDSLDLKSLDGESLIPIFSGEDRPIHEYLFFEHYGCRALRYGKWKIVSSFPDNKWSLYDMDTDRTELRDLSAEYPEIFKHMIAAYENKAVEYEVWDWKTLIKRNRDLKRKHN